jgi:hypothetical protein
MSGETKIYDEKLKDKTEYELIRHLIDEIDTFLAATGVPSYDVELLHHRRRLAQAAGTTSRELVRRGKKDGSD